MTSITVVEGSYLGLTIGESTTEDADALFGSLPVDSSYSLHSDDPNVTRVRSNYRNRDGADISVFFENGRVTRISASKADG